MTRTGRCPVPAVRFDAPLADTSNRPVGWRTRRAARRHCNSPSPPAGPEPHPDLLPTLPTRPPHQLPRKPRDALADDVSIPGRREPTEPNCRADPAATATPKGSAPGRTCAHASATSPVRPTGPPPGCHTPCGAGFPCGYRLPGVPLPARAILKIARCQTKTRLRQRRTCRPATSRSLAGRSPGNEVPGMPPVGFRSGKARIIADRSGGDRRSTCACQQLCSRQTVNRSNPKSPARGRFLCIKATDCHKRSTRFPQSWIIRSVPLRIPVIGYGWRVDVTGARV